MSKSKARMSDASIFEEGETIYQITPTSTWRGAPEFIGKKVKVVLRSDDNYYGADGGYYVMGAGSWELVE